MTSTFALAGDIDQPRTDRASISAAAGLICPLAGEHCSDGTGLAGVQGDGGSPAGAGVAPECGDTEQIFVTVRGPIGAGDASAVIGVAGACAASAKAAGAEPFTKASTVSMSLAKGSELQSLGTMVAQPETDGVLLPAISAAASP